jgi:hypothetical protein
MIPWKRLAGPCPIEGGGGWDGPVCEDWLGPPRASRSRRKREMSSSYLCESLVGARRKSLGQNGKDILLLHLHVRLLELEDLAADKFHLLDLVCD